MIKFDEIKKLSFQEKLNLLEELWEDILMYEQEIEVPNSHKEILDVREGLVEEGKTHFVDWEKAKKEIRKSVDENSDS